MVEIVLNSQTTTHIHTHYGGGPQKGARDITTHLKYINEVNNNNITEVNKARDIYSRSCAGYNIASYVLGLGMICLINIYLTFTINIYIMFF